MEVETFTSRRRGSENNVNEIQILSVYRGFRDDGRATIDRVPPLLNQSPPPFVLGCRKEASSAKVNREGKRVHTRPRDNIDANGERRTANVSFSCVDRRQQFRGGNLGRRLNNV